MDWGAIGRQQAHAVAGKALKIWQVVEVGHRRENASVPSLILISTHSLSLAEYLKKGCEGGHARSCGLYGDALLVRVPVVGLQLTPVRGV